MEKEEEPKIENVHLCFGHLLMENTPARNQLQNSRFLHISHRHTSPTHDTNRCSTATYVSNPKCLQAFSQREWSCPHGELFAVEKMAVAGMGNKKITEFLSVAQTWQTVSCAQRHCAKTRHLTLQGQIFFERAAKGRKTKCKKEGGPFWKNEFLQCALFLLQEADSQKHMFWTACIFGRPIRCFSRFSFFFRTFMFFDPPKGCPNHEKKGPFFELGHPNCQRPHSDPKKSAPKSAHSEFWREANGS